MILVMTNVFLFFSLISFSNPFSGCFSLPNPARREGGGYSCEKSEDTQRKFCIKPLKETSLGVTQT